MLTRLELIGFKSFAERTRFDFAPGVTAVVGPNGSGKSNIVDAVRWLLGEQSAKNLRGGEMTDVIFNGSATRKSLGMAEVTMTFDNARRILSHDTDEVQITRRVYRDGQGEYLINGQDARLKDIKELFLGSGAGHGAYSVIEQGRVDALLSASTKDRRMIFEEAAGISRFKAKKIETLRKLERVDGDLVRVHDILTELDKQLRTLRLQAAKARRYQEYTNRLRDLRVSVGRAEYRTLGEGLTREEAALAELRAALAEATAQTTTDEEDLRRLDREWTQSEENLRLQEGKLAEARQQIAAAEATVRAERAQLAALEQEALRLGGQRFDLGMRSAAIDTELGRVRNEVERMAGQEVTERATAEAAAAALAAITTRINQLTATIQADRSRQFDLVNRAAKLHSDADLARAQADRIRREITRKESDATQAKSRHDAIERVLTDLSETDQGLKQKLADARQSLQQHQTARDELRARAEQFQKDLDAAREERSAALGRADVLERLERSLEGFGTGARAVWERVRAGEQPLAEAILGPVVDFLRAPGELAPLIDLVLGDQAQGLVLREGANLDSVLAALGEIPGRVRLLPLQGGATTTTELHPQSLARFVYADMPGLAERLLGSVILVESLTEARHLSPTMPGVRWVCRTGEVLEPDGTVSLGPLQAEIGILSRKTELRELQNRIRRLDETIQRIEHEQQELRAAADLHAGPILQHEAEIATLTGEAGSLRDQILEQRQVQRQLAENLELLRSEITILEGEWQRADEAGRAAGDQAATVDAEAKLLASQLADQEHALTEANRERDRLSQEDTAAQVSLERFREQYASLRKKRDELETELRHRRIDGVNLTSAERSNQGKIQEATLVILRVTATAATAYADKERRERKISTLTHDREILQSERELVSRRLTALRDLWKGRQDEAHARELTVRDLSARRDSIAQRIREEYGLDLAGEVTEESDEPILLTVAPEEGAEPPRDPREEIEECRQKIAKLGSVNLEALEELEDVEKRETELRSQFDDLTSSRTKLQQIIDQINNDSRTLFADTMSTVRGHFQELFRKLFGGGMADIVLEDETDILESGIEITARPPGKELTRISLLSGGERALTAVALLLAIFRSKPSPFCLLDEVDAAMDEANTQRLATLVKEFSDRSQFIIITHKKRTMAVADVLHGVTMQESGVSKVVAVRFEDWPDEDHPPRLAAA